MQFISGESIVQFIPQNFCYLKPTSETDLPVPQLLVILYKIIMLKTYNNIKDGNKNMSNEKF